MRSRGNQITALCDMPDWHVTQSIQEALSNRPSFENPSSALVTVQHRRKRVQLAAQEGTGYYDFVHVNPELMLLVCNRNLYQDLAVKLLCEGFLKVHFRVSGDADLIFSDGKSYSINGLYCGMMTQPSGSSNGVQYRSGSDEKWATIFCGPNQLMELINQDHDQLPKSLQGFVNNNASGIYNCHLSMQPAMTYALSSIINPRVSKPLERIQTEAAILELLSLALNEILTGKSAAQSFKLKKRDVSRLQDVKEILCANYADPPTILELSRLVGFNQGKLNQGFKSVFGMNISRFIADCRMKEALRLLEEGELNITQISEWVGYEYSSNFSIAFKRYFGVAPKSFSARL